MIRLTPLTITKLALAVGGFALTRTRPTSRLLVLIPIIQAGFSMATANTQADRIKSGRKASKHEAAGEIANAV